MTRACVCARTGVTDTREHLLTLDDWAFLYARLVCDIDAVRGDNVRHERPPPDWQGCSNGHLQRVQRVAGKQLLVGVDRDGSVVAGDGSLAEARPRSDGPCRGSAP